MLRLSRFACIRLWAHSLLVFLRPHASNGQTFIRASSADVLWFGILRQATSLVGKSTWLERILTHIKENPWVAATILLATSLIAVARYAREIRELIESLRTTSAERARTTLASLKLEFTADVFAECAARGDRQAVELFLTAGMDPNMRGRGDNYALSHAVKRGDIPMVKALLKAKADISVEDRDGWTALDRATEATPEMMKVLLEENPSDELMNSARVNAAEYGSKEMLSLLVPQGTDLKGIGSRALIWAAGKPEKSENVGYLLEQGVDVNSRNEEGRTALHEAAFRGSWESVRVLLKKRAEVDARVGDQDYAAGSTALVIAAGQGDERAVTALIDAGADVNASNKRGETALMVVVDNLHPDTRDNLVDTLLRKGADVNARDAEGKTALMRVTRSSLSLVQRFLDSDADVNLPDNKGETSLMRCASGWEPEILRALLDCGADANAKNQAGQTALTFAASEGGVTATRILLDHKADVNTSDATGKTPLMYAAEGGRPDTVRVLLERGAQVDRKDRDGRTALQFADDCREEDMKKQAVRILKAAGAH